MSPGTKSQENTPKRKKGETLKEKVRRHINDKEDKITEEDLRDVVVGTNAVDVENQDEPSVTIKDLPKKKKVTTPWDVLKDEEEIPES